MIDEGDPALRDTLSLRVVDAKQTNLWSSMKMSTPFRKLMDNCCQPRGLDRPHVRFHFGSRRFEDEKTPGDYKMYDLMTLMQ